MKSQVEIYDTTLRDGAQAEGINFSAQDKLRIAERLVLGATTYGPLDIASDPRSFRSREAREEVEDALVYLACAWLKGEEVAS